MVLILYCRVSLAQAQQAATEANAAKVKGGASSADRKGDIVKHGSTSAAGKTEVKTEGLVRNLNDFRALVSM